MKKNRRKFKNNCALVSWSSKDDIKSHNKRSHDHDENIYLMVGINIAFLSSFAFAICTVAC